MDHNITDLSSGQVYEMVLKDQSVLEGIDEATDYIDLADASRSAPDQQQSSSLPLAVLENQELQQDHKLEIKRRQLIQKRQFNKKDKNYYE